MSNTNMSQLERENWRRAVHLCPRDILVEELERRKIEATTPKPICGTITGFEPVRQYCISYINQLAEPEPYQDFRLKDCIFEAAVEAVFGKDIWKWVNARLK